MLAKKEKKRKEAVSVLYGFLQSSMQIIQTVMVPKCDNREKRPEKKRQTAVLTYINR